MKDILGFCDVPLLDGRVVAAVSISTISCRVTAALLNTARTVHRTY
jgi:hypothetical protein